MPEIAKYMDSIIEKNETISVVPFSEDLKIEWDSFINSRSINGTFLHSRKFYDHNPLNSTDDSSLIFYRNNKIIAIFPAVLYAKNGCLTLHSHLRSTYGGLVVSKDVNVEIAIQLIGLIVLFAKEKSVKQIIVRNPFRIFNTHFCDETDYAMWYHGFAIQSRELEVVIPISGNIEVIKSQFKTNTRRNIQKSAQTVEVLILSDFRDYWNLLEKCLLERHGKRPVHDYNSISRLRQNVGEDKVLLFAAHHNGRLIAGSVVFNFADSVLHCQYIASDAEFEYLRPVQAVIDFIIHWGNRRGCKYLDLGTANEEEGKKINSGLFRFKESFGGRGVLRETMYLNL